MPSFDLALEIFAFGAATAWLLGLIPAAWVCVRHKEWAGFIAGWLTFGLAWVVCATALLSRRTRIRALIATAAAIGVLGVFDARPTPILGMDGGSLHRSFGGGGGILLTDSGPCHNLGNSSWSCGHYDQAFSTEMPFRLEVDRLGCWKARREWRNNGVGPVRYRGCVTILDRLF